MKLIDPAHPFYKPPGTRIAIVAMCGVWFAGEMMWGGRDPFFTPIAGGLFAYTAWVLLIRWRDPPAQ